MKQVTQNYRTGRIRLEDVATPAPRTGGVLVATAFSVVSTGTEGMKVRQGRMSLLGKARARPDQVRKVLRTLKQQGPVATYEKVMSRLDSLTPLGYSLSGLVLDVGRKAAEFQAGQRVACAGAEYAHHAEVVSVPRNLVVPVPDGVSLEHAAFATIGAIALHGFRRSQMQLGEVAGVVGLGLLGQILVQILRAAGIRAVGIDLSGERCEQARALGATVAAKPDDPTLASSVSSLTSGHGLDCVFIVAGGDSNGPVELAVELARDRARVVDVGKTRIDLPWNDYYMKELEFVFSRSYGPGRYDPSYEVAGVDYPIGYVRWTERRNMAGFLDLVAEGRVQLDPIISAVRPIEEAEAGYEDVAKGRAGLGLLFRYPGVDTNSPESKPAEPSPRRPAGDPVGIGVVGAGNYAMSMLLPHFAREKKARLVQVATRTPLSAANASRRFPFERSGTDTEGLLGAADVDAIVIATRHSSHAELAAAALRTGRSVFVEKPLAIDRGGVEGVRRAAAESGNDRLQVGFNRRFAPLVREIRSFFEGRAYPLFMVYRVHAGALESGSWYSDPAEGSRFCGEGGHFLDVLSFLADARPRRVSATCLSPGKRTGDEHDNVSAAVTYADGSVGQVLYLTRGASKVPKEELEVFGGGRTARLHNFTSLELLEGDDVRRRSATLDKGQRGEVAAFVEAARSGGPLPFAFDDLLDTTLVTLAVGDSLRRGEAVDLEEYWAPDESQAEAPPEA